MHFFWSLVLSVAVSFQAGGAEEKLAQKVEKLIKSSGLSSKSLSLFIKRVGKPSGDSKVFAHNEKQLRIPASLTKIFTAGAVLDEFSPGHQFKTRIFRDKKGHLYLKGGGDPSFVSEKMWFLVNELRRQEISQVKDIVVDDRLFVQDLYPGRSRRRVDRAYDAPLSAMSFNWNSVNIFVKKTGKKAKVFIDPENEYIDLKSEISFGAKQKLRVSRVKKEKNDLIIVKGTIPRSFNEKVFYKSISYPSLWSGANLKAFLQQRGVKVSGRVRRGKTPQGATPVAESLSKPLALMISDLMKFSNNYVADMLTLQMSLKKTQPGELSVGLAEIDRFIKKSKSWQKGSGIKNASGLTRENLFSVWQIVQTLDYVHSRFDLSAEFINSLPIAGVDGTLKSRMKNGPAKKWLRAKTGLLSGVAGLAGYAGRRDGVVFSFAFLYNGENGKEYLARQLFDRLGHAMVSSF